MGRRIRLGGRGESAAPFVTEQGQAVHEERVTDEVDLLAEEADALGSAGFRCLQRLDEALDVGQRFTTVADHLDVHPSLKPGERCWSILGRLVAERKGVPHRFHEELRGTELRGIAVDLPLEGLFNFVLTPRVWLVCDAKS